MAELTEKYFYSYFKFLLEQREQEKKKTGNCSATLLSCKLLFLEIVGAFQFDFVEEIEYLRSCN